MKEQKRIPFKSPWNPNIPKNERHSSLSLTFVSKTDDGKPIEFVAPLGYVKWTSFTPDELAVRIMNAIGDSVVRTVKEYSDTHPDFIEIVQPQEVPADGEQNKNNKTKQGKPNMAIQKKVAVKKTVKKAVKAPAKKAAVKATKKTCCCKCGAKKPVKKSSKK